MATSAPRIHHFYHIYADGIWHDPVMEHLAALKSSGLATEKGFSFGVGLVGNDENIASVRHRLDLEIGSWQEVASSPAGW